jgi:hypothetical protein
MNCPENLALELVTSPERLQLFPAMNSKCNYDNPGLLRCVLLAELRNSSYIQWRSKLAHALAGVFSRNPDHKYSETSAMSNKIALVSLDFIRTRSHVC